MLTKIEHLNTPKLLCKFLEKMMGIIRQLPDEMKTQLIVRKLNLDSLLTAEDTSSLNLRIQLGKIYDCSSERTESTNLLALAVCTANIAACRLFLNHFSKLTDPSHFVKGYRQKYSWLHLALDPHGHLGNEKFRDELLNIKNRLEVIELLANKGADPNWRGNDLYSNPPIAAGRPSGHFYDVEITKQLRIKLLSCGADPSIGGSSFTLSEREINELKSASAYVLEHSSTAERLTI